MNSVEVTIFGLLILVVLVAIGAFFSRFLTARQASNELDEHQA
jgi:hypothetical protein